MRVRGVVRAGSGGASGVRGSEAWVMSIELRPWRDEGGAPKDSRLLVWQWCANEAELRVAQGELSPAGMVAELECSAPERVRGLEFRERGEHELELTAMLGTVSDPELQVLAVALAPPATIEHPALGTLRWNDRLSRYHVERTCPSGEYTLAVELDDPRAPDLTQVGSAVRAFEGRFGELQLAVAREVYELWRDDWRDEDDEPVVPLVEFARRLPLSGLTVETNGRLAVAYFGDAGMFGRHSIEVSFDDDGEVQGADLVG